MLDSSLIKASLPPLVLALTNGNAEDIDWMSTQVIDPDRIATIRTTIESSYPRRKTKWEQSPYPDKDLTRSINFYSRNHSYARFSDDETFYRYNPFRFRLPYGLLAFDHFFNSRCFHHGSFPPPGYLRKDTATEQYLNFLREYHLLYADILEAMNGCGEALQRIQTKLDTEEMYLKAGIDTGNLQLPNQVDNSSVTFRRSLVAYLALDILRSPEANLSTAARVKALDILYYFDIDSIATAFSKYSFGFCAGQDEPVEDLIPRSFMTTAEEKGGTRHNELFAKNRKIRHLFGMKPQGNDINFDEGLSTLLRHHQRETVQVLISLLRCDTWGFRKDLLKLVFHALANLSRLDSIQKGELFGARASYRADFQLAGSSGLQSRVGATTGIGGGFGDGLEALSREELIARVRQHQAYEQLLEKLVATRATKLATANKSFNDPKAYFRILGLDSTIGENFDLLLTACYRTMARKCHPDMPGGSKEMFQKIQYAYEVLSDPDLRNKYLTSGRYG